MNYYQKIYDLIVEATKAKEARTHKANMLNQEKKTTKPSRGKYDQFKVHYLTSMERYKRNAREALGIKK